MTSRHPNDPPTPTLRVLVCTKCGDRHTVDVSAELAEARAAALSEAATAVEGLRGAGDDEFWVARAAVLAILRGAP